VAATAYTLATRSQRRRLRTSSIVATRGAASGDGSFLVGTGAGLSAGSPAAGGVGPLG